MAFDASGTFTRLRGKDSWKGDATAGTKIKSDLHDDNDNDLASGLSECITKTGKGIPIVDIPWGGKQITNLGVPTQPAHAATKNYVDTLPGWETAKYIHGADLEGRLNFNAVSGVNGITWTYVDLSWVARHAKAGEASDRLVMNPNVAPSTTTGISDVFVIDTTGRINNAGVLTHNTSYDGVTPRAISPGVGTLLTYAGGVFNVQSNDVATITNNYASFTPRTFFQVQNSAGSVFMTLTKNGTNKYNRIYFNNGTELRWIIDAGNATPETGTRAGSDFIIYSYDNTGAAAVAEMSINRETHKVTFNGEVVATNLTTTDANMVVGPSTAQSDFTMARPITSGSLQLYGGTTPSTGSFIQLFGSTKTTYAYDIILGTNGTFRYMFDYSANNHLWQNNAAANVMTLAGATGNLTITGRMTADSWFVGSTTSTYLAATGAGAVTLRPNGADVATGEARLDSSGDLRICGAIAAAPGGVYAGRGLMSKAGYQGVYGGNWCNLYYNGSGVRLYVDAIDLGQIAYSSDYRLKKDIQPLPSMWDRVKSLVPVSYSQKAWNIFVDDDTPRWGFVAHELQERLIESAASGKKDEENVVQSPDIMAVVAALTKALQEAMGRIESLEARVPA